MIYDEKNYNFDYYYTARYIFVQIGKKIVKGYFYIQLRLDTKFMENEQIRANLGFKTFDEIPPDDKGVSIDREKNFHCAASKGLVGHIQFTLIPVDPKALPDAVWKNAYNSRLTYSRIMDFSQLTSFLYNFVFTSPITKAGYRIKPGSIREVRRKRDN